MLRLIEKSKKVKDFRQASGTKDQLVVVLLIIILGIMQSYTSMLILKPDKVGESLSKIETQPGTIQKLRKKTGTIVREKPR